jgi:hypothetical protein
LPVILRSIPCVTQQRLHDRNPTTGIIATPPKKTYVRYSREDVMRSTKMMPSASLKYLLNFSVLILVLRFLQISQGITLSSTSVGTTRSGDGASNRRFGCSCVSIHAGTLHSGHLALLLGACSRQCCSLPRVDRPICDRADDRRQPQPRFPSCTANN